MRRAALAPYLAITLMSSVAWAQPKPADAEVAEARTHFARGVQSFKEGDNRAALAEFNRAYKLAPNFKLLYNIAQTCAELQDYPCALRSMQQYLADGKAQLSPARRAAGQAEVDRFKVLVATLTIKVNVDGAQVLVDDAPVGTSPLAAPLMVSTGQRRIAVLYHGLAPVVRVIELAGGDAPVVDIAVNEPPPTPAPPAAVTPPAPPPAPPPADVASHQEAERPSLTPVWIGAVATVALGAATGITGMVTLGKRQDLQTAVGQYPQPSNVSALRSQVGTFGAVTDGLLAAMVVAAGATLVLYLTRSPASAAGYQGGATATGVHATATGLGVSF